MKKLILSAVVFLTAITSSAQSEKYTSAMRSNIAAMDTSYRNPANLLVLANTFERIGMAEKSQWLPYYYAALMQVNYGFMINDVTKNDALADKAALLISKADSLSPGNSEISTVKSMIATLQLLVDPMTRYMEFGQVSAGELEKAIAQDPSNPRPYYLKGQSLKYTPEQFGGGCKTAKAQLETSINKFATFKPASELHPVWGKERTQVILQECQ
ncbi:MAG: hypothetical protein WKF35_05630 [Ferruginibacter sp.]